MKPMPGLFGLLMLIALAALPARAGRGLPATAPAPATASAPLPAPTPLIAAPGRPLLARASPLVVIRAPMITVRATTPPDKGSGNTSLFDGRLGLLAPMPAGPPPATAPTRLPDGLDGLATIRALIGRAEAGAMGYDAVQHGARIRPPRPPTQMTIAEIRNWIAATPGQPHAIGYYQFIPDTLERLIALTGTPAHARFTPALQDRLANVLLAEAGLAELRAGTLHRHAFMNNLARIWAGLPNDTGKSHYDGYAGNRANISWEYFDREMARAFPG